MKNFIKTLSSTVKQPRAESGLSKQKQLSGWKLKNGVAYKKIAYLRNSLK